MMTETGLTPLLSFDWQPLIDGRWLMAGLCLGVLIAAWGVWRRIPGTGWRLGIWLILCGFLAHPVIRRAQITAWPDIAVIAVDESASNRIGARPIITQKILEHLSRIGATLPNLEWRVVRFGRQAEDHIEDNTALFAALDRATRDMPRQRLAGTIIISDGQIHDAPAIWPKEYGPLHVMIPGQAGDTDRSLRLIDAPAFGLTGQEVTLRLRVADLGIKTTATAPIALSLRRDQDDPVQMILDASTADPATGNQLISVPITHPGDNIFELEVAPLAGEVSQLNNRTRLTINGVRDRLKVLLVSGHPYPGERTWRNLLKSDPGVDLVHFTILRTPEKLDTTPIRELSLIAFPVRELFEIKLHEFDLVIFDNYEQQGILPNQYYQNIVDYVRQGGALLIVNGASYGGDSSLYNTALKDILPAAPTGQAIKTPYRPQITDLGRRHIVTAPQNGTQPAEWGRWLRTLPTQKTSGDILMTGANQQPLLILDHQEKGRIAQLNSDHIWLWDRGYDGGGPHGEFLRRLAHWLMKEPELAENSLHATITGKELRITRRDLKAETTTLLMTAPDGTLSKHSLTLDKTGLGTLNIPVDMPGTWRIEDGDLLAIAQAGRINAPEMADLRQDAQPLRDLVRETGGRVFWYDPDNMPDLRRTEWRDRQSGPNWIGLPQRHQGQIHDARTIDLLPGWLAALLGAGLLLAGWYREGR